jgi:hypothetical protein
MKVKQAIALMFHVCSSVVNAAKALHRGGTIKRKRKMLTRILLGMALMLWGVNAANAVTNINPNMTFGDLPVVGVIGSYNGNNEPGFVAGYTPNDDCPPGTARINVNGFDFTPYNGWNGTHTIRYQFGWFIYYETHSVATLCVVPK